jgi:hypothetical protein
MIRILEKIHAHVNSSKPPTFSRVEIKKVQTSRVGAFGGHGVF